MMMPPPYGAMLPPHGMIPPPHQSLAYYGAAATASMLPQASPLDASGKPLVAPSSIPEAKVVGVFTTAAR